MMPAILKRTVLTCGLMLASFMVPAVNAEILEATDAGFSLKFESQISASPSAVDQQLLKIGEWWEASHTYTGKSNNLYIDINQGCFCEKLEQGGLVYHMRIGQYHPGKLMRFLGGLGPLQTIPVAGVLDFNIKPIENNKTQLVVTYQVNGSGLKNWAGPVNQVIQQQVDNLTKKANQ